MLQWGHDNAVLECIEKHREITLEGIDVDECLGPCGINKVGTSAAGCVRLNRQRGRDTAERGMREHVFTTQCPVSQRKLTPSPWGEDVANATDEGRHYSGARNARASLHASMPRLAAQ